MDERSEAGLAQLVECTQETGHQPFALFAGFVFLQQEIAEPLFEPVDYLDGGMVGQVRIQFFALLRPEIMAMPPHQRKQAAVLRFFHPAGSNSRQQARK